MAFLTNFFSILYINSVSQFVSVSVCWGPETHITFNKIVPPNSRAQKLFRTSSSYFYFYVCFCVATAVVDGGGIFGIWRVGEEIWVRFFWAKGLGGSCGGGEGWGWGSRGLTRWKWTGVGNAKDRVGGIDGVHYAPGSH